MCARILVTALVGLALTMCNAPSQPVALAGEVAQRGRESAVIESQFGKKPLAGKVILHLGDSLMGGGWGGMSRTLGDLFEDEGAKFVRDVWEGVSIVTFDESTRFKKLLTTYNPDIVILTVGANDVSSWIPDTLVKHVDSVVRRVGPRECYWIGPAAWKKDTGIVSILRDHAAPCVFFDSSGLTLERRGDGIHPTREGGQAWAYAFWDFYSSRPRERVGVR